MKNILFFTIPLCIYLFSFHFLQNIQNSILLTLLLTTIIFWAITLIPSYQTSLIFLFGTLFFSLESKEIVFSGFSSSAFWLVFAGMLIANAIKDTGLTNRLGTIFGELNSPSYLKILISLNTFALLFSFIMPSAIIRIILLVPIAIGIAKNFGFQKNSKGYIGIILGLVLSTHLSAFSILPSNLPNMILSGMSESLYGYKFLYSHYLFVNFLVLGLLKTIIITVIIYYFYKDEVQVKSKSKKSIITHISKNEKIVSIVLCIMVLLWMTDFIHHLSVSLIAILGVLVLANPSINIIKEENLKSLNFPLLLFVATLISFGNIISNNLFIKESLQEIMNIHNFSHSPFINYMFITLSSTFTAIFTTQPTVPALLTPIANSLSTITTFSLDQILMMQVVGFSTVLFPFQAPPIIIAMQLAKIKYIEIIKILLVVSFISIVFLYPLNYLWWKIIY